MNRMGVEIWKSPIVEQYSEKFVEDCYIDAYSEFAKGRSFSMQLSVAAKPRFFLKPVTGFMITVCIFDNPLDLHSFVQQGGEDKFVEVFYSIDKV